MAFIFQQILFFISIILVLFVPGYFLLLAIYGKRKILASHHENLWNKLWREQICGAGFSDIEKFVITFGLSIIIIDFLMILAGKIGIPLNTLSILSLIIIFSIACYAIYKFYTLRRPTQDVEDKVKLASELEFSKNQVVLIILILFLTIFIKTIYLSDSIFPTSTDLGHHMYWSKLISETGELPTYQEADIIMVNENYQISQPQPIADFIIGEHLIFSAINLISGISFISYFPSLVLFLVNVTGILAMFILTLHLFKKYSYGKSIAIFSLFLLGPLYAISSAQAKFVSGGVIGNLLGNLFIPLALYFFFRALKEKSSVFLALALFMTAGLFYTHHLSAFIFIYIFAFSLLIFIIFNIKNTLSYLKGWLKIILSKPVIVFLIFAILFFIFIYTPTYITGSAIDTAVGEPSKATRAGLTFSQLKFTAGEARMALGIIGLAILLILRTRKTYTSAIVIGWTIAVLLMSLKPQWLYLDIPSNRIANYTAYPLSITGAFVFVWIISKIKNIPLKKYYLKPRLLIASGLALITFIATSGFYDNSQSLKSQGDYQDAVQTFHASSYLAENSETGDTLLKDHNYIVADAWIKLYFMQDYNYPLSRGFFKRYEDEIKKREMCTLWMISIPNTENGQQCFSGTGTNFIMVDPNFDGPQFEKGKNFWKIYSGDEIGIYYKKS